MEGIKEMKSIARIILFICSENRLSLKSDSQGNISLIFNDEEISINDISDTYQVKIFREFQPAKADYSIIEEV